MSATPSAGAEIQLLITDSRRARWLRAWRDGRGRCHFVEEEGLDLAFAESQHGRPGALSQRGGFVYAAPSHEDDEKAKTFTRQLETFVQAKLGGDAERRVHVFAPARFLGALRHGLSASLRQRIVEHEGELINFDVSRLAAHAPLVQLFDA